jgi:hypothetical protein
MPAKRRLYPGDPIGEPPKPAPPRKPDKIKIYTVFWRDFDERQKGTNWMYHSRELREAGGLAHDKDIPWSTQGYRSSLLMARGKRWRAIYCDGEQYSFLASPSHKENDGQNRVSVDQSTTETSTRKWPRFSFA